MGRETNNLGASPHISWRRDALVAFRVALCPGLLIFRWRQLPAGVDELRFSFGELQPVQRGARNQQQIGAGWDQMLMAAENLAQPSFRGVAAHGRTHRGGRRHDADPDDRRWSGRRVFAPAPQQGEDPAIEAAALRAHAAEIVLASQMLLGAKVHG